MILFIADAFLPYFKGYITFHVTQINFEKPLFTVYAVVFLNSNMRVFPSFFLIIDSDFTQAVYWL